MLHEGTAAELAALLDGSRAAAEFRRAVLDYAAGRAAPLVAVVRPAPRVKVLRVLSQLLYAEPGLRVGRVVVDAVAGCCDFRGSLVAFDGVLAHAWQFRWDCRWRAEQAGLYDRWGSPDQSRAAREFTWRCFARWEPVSSDGGHASGVEQRP
jgi:hypothetical protein